MRKKIILGSIFVLTLLLLMPSTSAIQQKTIEDRIKNDLEQIKYPILNALIFCILTIRLIRFYRIREFSADFINVWHEFGYWDIQYPLLYMYSLRIFMKFFIRCLFWDYLSVKLEWNWKSPIYN